MKLGIALTTLACVLLVTLPAGALSSCHATTSTPTAQVGDGHGTTVYVVESKACPGGSGSSDVGSCAGRTFTILEANGLPGLQRYDADVDDTCGGTFVSDLYVA